MRSALISFIAVLGCAAAVGASPKSVDSALPMPGSDKPAGETALTHPVVPLSQLIDEFPDGAHVIGVYQAVRIVSDVEEANAQLKVQVTKSQTVASDVARIHAAATRSCESIEASQIEEIALKAKSFAAIVVRVDGELTRSLAAMRQKAEVERAASIRAKEAVNRFSLATHEVGRLRLQAQEIARTIENLGVSLRKLRASCTPREVPPLFAERDEPSKTPGTTKGSLLSNRRPPKPTAPLARRFAW